MDSIWSMQHDGLPPSRLVNKPGGPLPRVGEFTGVCPRCGATGSPAVGQGLVHRIDCGCGAIALGAPCPDAALIPQAAARAFNVADARVESGALEVMCGGMCEDIHYYWYAAWTGARGDSPAQVERLARMGEAEYNQMYEPGGRVILGEVRECFGEAIAMARRLGLRDRADELQKRYEKIRDIILHQG